MEGRREGGMEGRRDGGSCKTKIHEQSDIRRKGRGERMLRRESRVVRNRDEKMEKKKGEGTYSRALSGDRF